MLEEGKRHRNGALTGDFVPEAARGEHLAVVQFVGQLGDKNEVPDSVTYKRPLGAVSTAGLAAETVAKRQKALHNSAAVSVGDTLSDHEDACEAHSENEGEQLSADARGSAEACAAAARLANNAAAQEDRGVHMFRATASTFDDWLHRGFLLQDMNFHTYVAYIEVTPRSRGKLGECFLFDAHYVKATTYWQRLARCMVVPRVVGAACSRMDVGDGEDNARYKLTLFGLTRCPGVGACADPVSLSAAYLFARSSSATLGREKEQLRFGPAWKARRAELEVSADEAERKVQLSKKLPTLVDCTAFRCLEGKELPWCHILVRQVLYHGHNKNQHAGAQNFCQLVATVCSFLRSDSTLYAEEQLHLAEFAAHRTWDMILRLDMHTEARNTAIQTARNKAVASVEEDAASVAEDEQQVLIEVENVGGEPGDGDEGLGVDDAAASRDAQGSEVLSLLPQDPDAVREQLLHSSLFDAAKQRGARTSDAVRFMLEVEKTLQCKIQVGQLSCS